MDNKMQERTNEAILLLRKRIKEHNNACEEFGKEFLKPEIRKMIKEIICNSKNFNKYKCCIGENCFIIHECMLLELKRKNGITHVYSTIVVPDDTEIYSLLSYAREISCAEEALKLFKENVGEIIESIYEDYEILNKEQNKLLDQVFEILGNTEPQKKQIKITIEYL